MQPTLYIVVPCYNEESVLPITAPLFLQTLQGLIGGGQVSSASKICFVDDGSSDGTWELIRNLVDSSALYAGISLSRNRGHQNALLAGLMEARLYADLAVSIDCDGQDDVSAIKKMVSKAAEGFDVVYGVRSSRASDSFFKRFSAECFYSLLQNMGVEVVFNHADYRLLTKRALDALSKYQEVNLFLRGIVPLIGFPSTTVEYVRETRVAGESHYPLSKMLHLAFDGITSLSIKPIRLITVCGFIFAMVGFVGIIWALFTAVVGAAVAGWASIVCILCLLGGIQLIGIGIIGEYIGKIYLETKHRPRFIISEKLGIPDNENGSESENADA